MAELPEQRAKATSNELTSNEIERYSRQLILKNWGRAQQMLLKDCSVCLPLANSVLALYLAGAGVGNLVLRLDGKECLEDAATEFSRRLLSLNPNLCVSFAKTVELELPVNYRLDYWVASPLEKAPEHNFPCLLTFSSSNSLIEGAGIEKVTLTPKMEPAMSADILALGLLHCLSTTAAELCAALLIIRHRLSL